MHMHYPPIREVADNLRKRPLLAERVSFWWQ